MVIQIKTFAGYDIQDATYSAVFVYEGAPLSRTASPVVLPVIGGFARDEGYDHQPASFHILINVRGDLTVGMDALKHAFTPGMRGELLVEFNGVDRQRTCRVEGVHPFAGSPTQLVVNLIAADPRWRSIDEVEDEEEITADGEQWNVTNDGNAIVDDAVFVITPTDQKAGTAAWRFRRHAVIANRVKRPLSDWPIDITNGGFDHAALVSASKSQADGDDVRVLEDGVEIPRYFGEHADHDANDDETTVWATPHWSAMQEAHLLEAISDSSPADGEALLVQKGETKSWPQKGYLLNEDSDEVIAYDGWTDANEEGFAAFLNIRRAQWGTAAASSSAGDHLLRAEHKLELIYGYTSAPAPEARPERKPLLDLASADLANTRWEWLKLYDDDYPGRPGGWMRLLQPRDSQAAFMYLPTGTPTGATWRYNYGPAVAGFEPFNVLRREFPVGTAGSTGQIGFGYDIDSTLALKVFGEVDGVEVEAGVLRGAAASTFASAAAIANKFHALSLYARSQVLLSTPEQPGFPLSSHGYPAGVIVGTNADGGKAQMLVNDTGGIIAILSVQALFYYAGATTQAVVVKAIADDGNGAPLGSGGDLLSETLAGATIATSSGAAEWERIALADRPSIVLPGQGVHVQLSTSGTHSSLSWFFIPMVIDGVGPVYAARVIGEGDISPSARAEINDEAGVTAVGVDLDPDGIPYFALTAEQDCYWLNGTLRNNTTQQAIHFALFVSPDDEIEVDCGRRTVTNLTTGEEGLIYGIEADDPDLWISLGPGSNELQWDEDGLVGVTVTTRFLSAWE